MILKPFLAILKHISTSSLYIKNCLSSIFSFYKDEIKKGEYELIIFDNASDDNTVNIIKDFLKDVKFKENILLKINNNNLGFGKGINNASSYAKGKFLLFLNSDTELLDKNFSHIIDNMNGNKKIGVLGGQIMDSFGNKEQSAGKQYNFLNTLFLALGLENRMKVRFSPIKESEVDFVSGGFMFVRKDLFEDIGGFDGKFFMYMEDVEMCF